MTRVLNADESLIEFRQARRRYEKESKGWVQKLAAQYDPRVGVGEDDVALIEEHVCSYLVTQFLHALNWNRSNGWNEPLFVENLLREAPVRSRAGKSRRRMDYLGFDRADVAPLLLLEAKAPSYDLPSVRHRRPSYVPDDRHEEIAEIIGRGLRGGEIAKHWEDWLSSTTDYVKACRQQTGVVPKRVVIMNDRWMVIFVNPGLCFDSLDECGRQDIRVYESLDTVEAEFVNVFRLLEHGQVLGPQKVQKIEKEALCVYVKPGDLRYALRGLLVNYDEVSRNDAYGPRPCIEVKPLLFLQTIIGSWFRLEAKEPQRIPIKMPALTDHLADVRAASDALVTAVKNFDFAVEVKDITFHYRTLIKELPGVRNLSTTMRHRKIEFSEQPPLVG